MIRYENCYQSPLAHLQCQAGLLNYKDEHISDSLQIIKTCSDRQYNLLDKRLVFK